MPEQVTSNPVDARKSEPMDHALRESEERFRSAFRDARIGMVIVSLEGCFLSVNRAFCEFLGYSEEELLRKDVASITYSEDLPRTIGLLPTVVAQGKQLPIYEKRYVHKDGQPRWGEVAAAVMRGVEGQPKYLVAQVLDIADRKRSQEAQLRFADLVESSDDAIIGKTIDGVITHWNKGAEQLYGYRAAEVIGKPISLLAPPGFCDDFHKIMAKVRRGETVFFGSSRRLCRMS
jgi:PAS domain S-box-containing protein